MQLDPQTNPEFSDELQDQESSAQSEVSSAVACTTHSARCTTTSDMKKVTNPCCVDKIYAVTDFVLDICQEVGIPIWADYGTLLGAVRHGALIPHDKDTDFGAFGEYYKLMLHHVRERAPAFGYHVMENGSRIKVRFSRENHNNIDIFFWWNNRLNKLYRTKYAQVDRFKGREFPRSWLKPFQMLPFGELMVPAPAQATKLLVHRYGSEWETPIAANNDGKIR